MKKTPNKTPAAKCGKGDKGMMASAPKGEPLAMLKSKVSPQYKAGGCVKAPKK